MLEVQDDPCAMGSFVAFRLNFSPGSKYCDNCLYEARATMCENRRAKVSAWEIEGVRNGLIAKLHTERLYSL